MERFEQEKRCPEGGVWSLEGLCSNNDYDDLDFYEIVSDKTAYLIDELITAEFDARNLFNELKDAVQRNYCFTVARLRW